VSRPHFAFALLHLQRASLLRANLLVLGSFFLSFPMSGFPQSRRNALLILPLLAAALGSFDTIRCLTPRRDLYHAGIILCLFMDLLVLTMILFFLFFPYLA
jgi:hypothetical protein